MIKRRSLKRRAGYLLVIVIVIMAVLAILVPAFVWRVRKESKDATATSKKTVAFQMAEAAVDRATWKLKESDAIWLSVVSGSTLTNYNNDLVYSDLPGGTYKVYITSGPVTGQVTVIGKGKSNGRDDVRAIKAIFSKGNTLGAMSVSGALDYKPNLAVEWGPVVSYTSIDHAPANYYPRKFSAGQVVGRDTTNDANNGALPSGNWTGYDYAAFYNLGTAPSVDLATYLTIAKNSCAPVLKKGTGSGSASPYVSGGCNTGYYPASTNSSGVKIENPGSGNYTYNCSTCVLYIETDVKRYPSGTWLNVKALIVTGDMDYNGGGTNYVATIPSAASDEYQYSPNGINYWTSNGWTNNGTYTVNDAGFHGFLYVGGNMNNAGGGATMVGAIYVLGDVSINTMTVYYDKDVGNNLLLANASMARVSWDEIVTSW